jgi:Putative Ig domain
VHLASRALVGLVAAAAVAQLALAAPASPVPIDGGNVDLQAHRTARVCTQPVPNQAACMAIKQTDTVEPPPLQQHAVTPQVNPAGYGPSSLRSAYSLDTTRGSGRTVAVVDAYDDPAAESDLASYRSQFSLPACTTANGCFRKVNQSGAASPLPVANTSWSGEISLDLDMVSAICPLCKILLVEASTPTMGALGQSVNTAVALGAKYVSNSYGGSESSAVTSFDDAYYKHPGVVITASSGDQDYNGGCCQYPATSKYVTAVGGTSLTQASNSRGWSETVWNTVSYTEGTGSGCSNYITQPTFQAGMTICGSGSSAKRAMADVAAVADPNTGVAVYQTYGGSGWAVYGGTSAAAPIIASVYALAGTPGASDFANAYPYAHRGNLFDVTSGANGSCGTAICRAGPGWDGPTGLGTPNGLAAFTPGGGSTGGNTVTVTNPGSRTGVAGTATSLQISTTDSGGAALSYQATGLPPGLSINASSGLISGTPSAARVYTVQVTAVDTTAASGGTSFTWSISPRVTCSAPGQKLLNPGFESGRSGWSASTRVIGQFAAAGEPPHAGSWDAWLDGYGTTHTDSLSQTVVIPARCTASMLTFYLHIDSVETTTTAQNDKLVVRLGATTLATYSNLNKAGGYIARTFSVGSLAGQGATLTFTGTENASARTSFVVDDVALTAA